MDRALEGNIDGDIRLSSPVGTIGASASAGSEVDWYGTLRLRAGWLITDSFLAYATGGAAYGKVKSGYSVGLGASGLMGEGGSIAFSDSTSDNSWGWDPRRWCGIPHQRSLELQGRVSLCRSRKPDFAERDRFVDWRDPELCGTAEIVLRTRTSQDQLGYRFHTVRVGVNYKFW